MADAIAVLPDIVIYLTGIESTPVSVENYIPGTGSRTGIWLDKMHQTEPIVRNRDKKFFS